MFRAAISRKSQAAAMSLLKRFVATKRSVLHEQQFLVKLKNDPETFGEQVNNDKFDEGDAKEARFLEERALSSRKLSTKKYADLIKSLVKRCRIKDALDVLEVKMLTEDRFKPENYIYNILISACARVGHTEKAFSLYNDMKKRQLKVTGATYTSLFNACANSPNVADGLARAKHLHQILIEKMYQPNDTNYNAMIKAYGRCGDISSAFGLVDEMLSRKFQVKDDTVNFLLQACASDEKNGLRHALLVWRRMIDLGIKPSIFIYNTMLRCVRDCDLGDEEDVEAFLCSIEKLKLTDSRQVLLETPTIGTGELRMSASCNKDLTPNLLAKVPHLGNLISVGQIKKPEHRFLLFGGARKFLENMEENGCAPNIKTYTQLLDVIPNTSAAEESLLNSMKKNKLKFDVDFFNALIKRRCFRSDREGTEKALTIMSKHNLKPNLMTYGVLALGCRKWIEAKQLLEEMKESKYRLNSEILGSFLYQACSTNNFPYVLDVMETCLRENVRPNGKFMEHLDRFKKACKRKIENNEFENEAKKSNFDKGYRIFRLRYKTWRNEVKIDDDEQAHHRPFEQFQVTTNSSESDRFFREKSERFPARHTSKFGVKTSSTKKHRR